MAEDVIIVRVQGETAELQAKLAEIEKELKKLGTTEKATTEIQKKASTELVVLSQKRKAAIASEETELKKLQPIMTAAFNPATIAKFDQAVVKTKNNISLLKGEVGTVEKATQSLGSKMPGIGAAMAAAFSVTALIAYGREAINVATQFESIRNAINFVQGGTEEGAKAFDFLISLSNRLGLELQSTAKSFKLFSASAQLGGISAEKTTDIFESVATAVTAMGLSADDAQGVFLALSQIISKGTVSAEELRGQIGERLPGAFEIAAKSIGVTTKQLNKMLEQGQLNSKDFLPAFATELKKTFSGALPQAVNSAQANFNRLSNIITDIKLKLGTGLTKGVLSLFDLFGGLKDKQIEPLKNLNDQFNIQIETLKRGNLSQENRKKLIGEINKEYGQYLPNLLTEKSTLDEIDKAQQSVNKAMLGRILLQSQEEEIAILLKNATSANKSLLQVELARSKIALDKVDALGLNTQKQKDLNEQEKLAQAILANTAGQIDNLTKEYEALAKQLGITTDKQKSFAVIKDNSKEIAAKLKKEQEAAEALQRELLKSGEAIIDSLAKAEVEALTATATSVTEIENGKLEVERSVFKRRIELRKNFGESTADLERQLAEFELGVRKKLLDDLEKAKEDKAKADIANAEKTADEIAAIWQKENDARIKAEKEAFDKRVALEEAYKQAAISAATSLSNAIFEIQSNNLQRQQKLELTDLDIRRENALKSKRLTEAERLKITNQFAAEQLRIEKRQFEERKKQATLEAIIKAALAVVETYATLGFPAGIPAAIAVAAATAAQIAVIQAQHFAKGKKEKEKGGPAYVGEKGTEFMYVPDNATILTADKTRKHKKLLDKMVYGDLEKYLYDEYIFPALVHQDKEFKRQEKKATVDSMAHAIHVQQGWNLRDAERIRERGMPISNTDELAKKIAAEMNSGYNIRRR